MSNKEEDKDNLLRAYSLLLYFTGSMIMHEPEQECISGFWEKGIIRQLPVRSKNPLFIQAAAELHESCENPGICLDSMKADYLQLFIGTKKMLAPPYESVLLGNEHIIFDLPALELREFYRAYGWRSGFEGKVPDDHLGTEVLFVNLLIDEYLSLDDDACRREMRNEMLRFLEEHPLRWVRQWQQLVMQHAGTRCYRGIAGLLTASLEDVAEIIRNW